jgi:NACHT domain
MADEPSATQHAQGSYIAQASQSGTATVQVYPVSVPPEQNRVRFLARLRYQYQELWEQSLQGAALMELGLANKPDAVQHQAELLFRPAQQVERLLPPGTSITQIYEEAGQELLILGEPGAGKSTLLLDLARHLVDCAEQDTQQPMPVLLPLSSWADKRQPLSDWLIEQMHLLYHVPTRLSSRWAQADQFLPLLDGLDEIPQEARLACIAAINQYHNEHLLPLVVCSRRAEYEELAQRQRLVLHSAVVVQPLTNQQINDYLVKAGEPLAALRTALQSNAGLQELTTTPLMLSVLSLTYAGASVGDLPTMGGTEEQQRIVFARYIEHMIERRRRHVSFSKRQALGWLSWLAQQMHQRNQTVFYLEQLQPDWLPPGPFRRRYEVFAEQLPSVVIGVLVSLLVFSFIGDNEISAIVIWIALLGGLVGGLVSGVEVGSFQFRNVTSAWKQRWHHLLRRGLYASLLLGTGTGLAFALAPDSIAWFTDSFRAGLIFGIVTGLCGLLLIIVIEAGEIPLPQKFPERPRFVFADQLRFGVLVGVLVWLLYGLSCVLLYGLSYGLLYWLSNGLYFGVILGIISTLLSHPFLKRKKVIEPAEILVWSGSRLGSSLTSRHHIIQTMRLFLLLSVLLGLSYGLGKGLGKGLSYGLSSGLSLGLILGLIIGLSYWAIIGFWSSLSRDTLDSHQRIRPNEGIRRSGRNGLLVGLIAGGLVGLLNVLQSILSFGLINALNIWLGIERSFNLSGDLSVGPLVGFVAGLLVALLAGGLAWLQHYLLRLQFWRAGVIPWRYIRFLDEATGCILLRKVGGGYSFVHRLLLDHFASLNIEQREPKGEAPSN